MAPSSRATSFVTAAEYSSSASLNIGGFVGQSSMFLSWTGWVMSITLSAQSSFDSLL